MSLHDFIQAQLQNQFMTGGLAVMAFGAVLVQMRNIPGKLWAVFHRRFITTVDVADHDQAFYWVQQWLASHEYTKKARLLTVSTRKSPFNPDRHHTVVSDKDEVEIIFSPAPGMHVFRHKGRWVMLWRDRRAMESISGGVAYHEAFVFRTFSKNVVQNIIEEAREFAHPAHDDSISVFRNQWGQWRLAMRRPPRDLSSVVLESGISDKIIKELDRFFVRAQWYKDHGIPYQRGYLLYGPPGSGKTSLVVAIASRFKRDIYVLRPSSLTDEAFQGAMLDIPPHGIILIEDVDCMWDKRESADHSQVSFDGFLNGIDGVAAPQGRILFMSTNHLDKLDDALIRPGRADKVFYVGPATWDQARRLFLNFFPGDDRMAEAFADSAKEEKGVSMAQLQERILDFPDDPVACAEAAE